MASPNAIVEPIHLKPGFNVASIAAKRRNKSNPWFMRGALFRSGGRAAAC
jgi:hypothetical protein